jgi:hypothetical protein
MVYWPGMGLLLRLKKHFLRAHELFEGLLLSLIGSLVDETIFP